MRRRISPIIIALCTAIVGASASFATPKSFNALGQGDKFFNGLGVSEGVPELQGFGGVALLTVVGAVGYGARKLYQKITRR